MKLKELRKIKNYNQTQIASYLNMTQSNYGKYELETVEPDIKTLCKLADFYNVSLDYLVGRDFKNDIGYLDEQDLEAINLFKSLNKSNKTEALAFIKGLYTAQ